MDSIQNGIAILREISICFSQVDTGKIQDLEQGIIVANRIFFVGAGRSRLMLSAFCMRLNQLGFESYIAGEIPCPVVRKGDLVIAASGSGTTPSIIAILKRIKKLQVPIFLFTATDGKRVDSFSSNILLIKAPNQLLNTPANTDSQQLMKTLFEQVVFLIGETVIKELSLTIPEKDIVARHTNLE